MKTKSDSAARELRLSAGPETWVFYIGQFGQKKGLVLAREVAGVRQPVQVWTGDEAFASSGPKALP